MSAVMKVAAFITILCPVAAGVCGQDSCRQQESGQDEVSLVQVQNIVNFGRKRHGANADPKDKDAKKDPKDKDAKKDADSPYVEAMKSRYGLYDAHIKAEEGLAKARGDAAKKAYVDGVEDYNKAAEETIKAREGLAEEAMKARYDAWYDNSPFTPADADADAEKDTDKKDKKLLLVEKTAGDPPAAPSDKEEGADEKDAASPYEAAMEARFDLYGKNVAATAAVNKARSEATKKAYVQGVEDYVDASEEAIEAREKAAIDTINSQYSTWYDDSPFHAEDDHWDPVGETSDDKKDDDAKAAEKLLLVEQMSSLDESGKQSAKDTLTSLMAVSKEVDQLDKSIFGSTIKEDDVASANKVKNQIDLMRTKLDQQDVMIRKMMNMLAKQQDDPPKAPKNELDGFKEESGFWHEMDPYLAHLSRDSHIYSTKIKAFDENYHDSSEAWKRAYVDQMHDWEQAETETINADSFAYKQKLNSDYSTWYDDSPFHSERYWWDNVGKHDSEDFAEEMAGTLLEGPAALAAKEAADKPK